jgi:predicted unusual protein kinase regulating ubiquinone biosynthesis (AarF/ABC1/UbiB family)
MGWMAGEVALGGLAEGARRLVGASSEVASVFATATNAQRLAKRLSGMRGAAMKLGQLLSLEGDDILPPEVADALAILRSDADAMPEAQLRRVLGHAYGKGWERRFQEFGIEPIAAASIGQVHYAVTTDGRELALKIQYPGVAKSIESDVDNLAAMLRLSRLLPGEIDMSGILTEAKRQLRQEADYRAEAEHLRRYAALVGDDPSFIVPCVHDDLTTAHILAMDYVAGEPLDQVSGGVQAVRDRVGRVLYRLFFREFFEFRFMQTDPNFANYLLLPDSEQIALLDLGAAHVIPPRLSGLYAQIFQAAVAGDRRGMRRVMLEIGFFDAAERDDRVEGLIDLFLLGCEPFCHRGVYDFGTSDLAARARVVGMDLTFKKGFLRPPPPEVIFLHRKLGGMFLLCARLKARVDVRAVLTPVLAGTAHD